MPTLQAGLPADVVRRPAATADSVGKSGVSESHEPEESQGTRRAEWAVPGAPSETARAVGGEPRVAGGDGALEGGAGSFQEPARTQNGATGQR